MANEGMKISQLPAATEVLDSDVVAGVGGGVTRKFTFATVASYIQTKLTALFSAKQDKITANGVLQGDGDGGVTAKTLDTSSLTNDNSHIPTSGVVKSALDGKENLWLTITVPKGGSATFKYGGTSAGVVAFTGGVVAGLWGIYGLFRYSSTGFYQVDMYAYQNPSLSFAMDSNGVVTISNSNTAYPAYVQIKPIWGTVSAS